MLIYQYVILPFLDHASPASLVCSGLLIPSILNLLYVLTLILGRWADLISLPWSNRESTGSRARDQKQRIHLFISSGTSVSIRKATAVWRTTWWLRSRLQKSSLSWSIGKLLNIDQGIQISLTQGSYFIVNSFLNNQ